jgi:hypothetical protein
MDQELKGLFYLIYFYLKIALFDFRNKTNQNFVKLNVVNSI